MRKFKVVVVALLSLILAVCTALADGEDQLAAIKAKGPDPAAIAGYLHNDLKNLDCFTGQISFDEKGDRVGDLYRLYEVNAKGEFILQPK